MKRKFNTLKIFLLLTLFILNTSACTQKKEETSSKEASQISTISEIRESSEDISQQSTTPQNLQDFADSNELKTLLQTISNETEKMEILTQNQNQILIKILSQKQLDNSGNIYQSYFETLTEKASENFMDFLKNMQEVLKSDDSSIIIQYYNQDGNLIYERVYDLKEKVQENSEETPEESTQESSEEEDPESSEEIEESSQEESSENKKPFQNIEELIKNNSFQRVLKKQIENPNEEQNYIFNLYTENTSELIYEIQYTEEISPEKYEYISDYIQSEEIIQLYQSVIESIQEYTEESFSIILRYKDSQNNIIAENQYFY